MLTNQYTKDPSAILDWAFDWTDWLAAAETITDHTITADTGITVDTSTEDAGVVTVWLSGGTAAENYKVACLVETSAGRTDERTIWIKVTNR
jgi:hypothetical protein